MEQRFCEKCGFPLGRRPNLFEKDGVCGACINAEVKEKIDFEARQKWLTEWIKKHKAEGEYDAIIAVSGGKDSHMIVKRLMENHGLENPLLVTCMDPFTQTETGKYNLQNIAEIYDLDHIVYKYKPQSAKKEALRDFENELNPMKTFEERTVGNSFPIKMAKKFGIPLVFYGENAPFEYGNEGVEELNIFHADSTEEVSVIFMGAIYPYSIMDSLKEAESVGFKSLDYYKEWDRIGQIENYTQIDSFGYLISQWTKYVKFGAQRVADIASRLCRENVLSREQAILLTKENDYMCDPKSKRDFCDTLGISEKYFDEIVEKHANRSIVDKDVNGNWKRKDLID